MSETTQSNLTPPPRNDVIAESHAVRVSEQRIHVWQYQPTLSDSNGAWAHVETLDRADDPKLSLEQATLTSPTEDGYWVYCRSYDCTLDCD